MNMYKSYQFRLYPDKQQIIQIQKTFGCIRLVYNHYLEKSKKANLTCFDMIKDLPNLYQKYPFLKEVDSCSLRCSLFDLDDAFKRYFNNQNNYPKFKGKYGSKRSYRANYITSAYKEKKYSKFLRDISLSKICSSLKYKVNYYGKRYIKIAPYYPSSQECSRCGYKNEKVKDLTVRDWICPECGSYHDSDINASQNILFEGIKKYTKELI